MHEDSINPVRWDLLCFPGRCLLQELIHFAVDLVKGADKNRETVRGAFADNPGDRFFETNDIHSLEQFTGKNVDRAPIGVG